MAKTDGNFRKLLAAAEGLAAMDGLTIDRFRAGEAYAEMLFAADRAKTEGSKANVVARAFDLLVILKLDRTEGFIDRFIIDLLPAGMGIPVELMRDVFGRDLAAARERFSSNAS